MGKDNMKLGPGMLYINGEKFGDATAIECTKEQEEINNCIDTIVRLGLASQEFSCSIKMATDAYVRFTHAMLGIDLALAEMCPNRRVVHLAKHAKKDRIRKKNYKRMIRECERRG